MIKGPCLFLRHRWFTGLLILLPFSFGTLNELLGLPWAIRYVLDVAWVMLLVIMLRQRYFRGNWKITGLTAWVLLFFLFTLVSYGFRYQSVLYYLWGVRNLFRFFAAFFAFAHFLEPEDTEAYLKILDALFWVNGAVSLFQFFVLGLAGDFLGGLFGAQKGGNAYTNLFFTIIVAKSLIFFLERQESAWCAVAKCAAALAVAAMAELKFFFVEFVLILMLAVVFTSPSRRKLWVLLMGAASVVCGAALLTSLFPEFRGWFSPQWLLEHAATDRGYTSSGDLNRLNAIPQINALWLRSMGERLVGLGLGNCETSTVALLNTPFFRANGEMHYTWISYAFLYLETGYVGLILYMAFFGWVFLRARRMGKRSHGRLRACCCLTEILAALCPLIAVYNSSLRTEAAYMFYFALAVPFSMRKQASCRNEVTDK